ncbi:hypothetical protein D3C76_1503490 [compost metagenome]
MDYLGLLLVLHAVGSGPAGLAVPAAAGFRGREFHNEVGWHSALDLHGVPAAALLAHAHAGEQDRVVADARALRFRQLQGAIADTARR